nr:MAG TPA: hypothetical protein [Caudoviricetes sp.]DAP31281.1 MAG TPA: hypothetical protein [Caudoviricetes sp.]
MKLWQYILFAGIFIIPIAIAYVIAHFDDRD